MKPIYLVIWQDSESDTGWLDEKDWDKEMGFAPIVSIGFLLKDTEKGIAMGLSWDRSNKRANPVLYIPHCCIVKMEEIELDGKD